MVKSVKRKGNRHATERRVPLADELRKRALKRALRAQKQIRALIGKLRRSTRATDAALLELHDDLAGRFGDDQANPAHGTGTNG